LRFALAELEAVGTKSFVFWLSRGMLLPSFYQEMAYFQLLRGGGGGIATPILFAIAHRLAHDHARARQIGACLSSLHPFVARVKPVTTNIVIFELSAAHDCQVNPKAKFYKVLFSAALQSRCSKGLYATPDIMSYIPPGPFYF